MIIYNVTVNIEASHNESWLKYMKSEHIPDVMKTGCFIDFTLSRILSTQADETGMTYSIQYKSPNMETYTKYQEQFAPGLQKEHTSKFEGKFVAFRTLLEVID